MIFGIIDSAGRLAGIRIYLNSRVSGDWVTNSLTAENIFGVHTRLSKENYKIYFKRNYRIWKVSIYTYLISY
jgi:hypothetical protein